VQDSELQAEDPYSPGWQASASAQLKQPKMTCVKQLAVGDGRLPGLHEVPAVKQHNRKICTSNTQDGITRCLHHTEQLAVNCADKHRALCIC
jgi:hypothetical protein